MNALGFLKQFIAHPNTVGALAASGRDLAEAIADAAGVSSARVVVEFGPGTGAITRAILPRLREDAEFFAVEINEDFVETLRRKFPGVTVHHDSAANTRAYLDAMELDGCDAIVSGLPWTVFPPELQDELLDAVADVLRPGGRFATFAYVSSTVLPSAERFRKKLRARFARIGKTGVVWNNLPPAVVYYAVKG